MTFILFLKLDIQDISAVGCALLDGLLKSAPEALFWCELLPALLRSIIHKMREVSIVRSDATRNEEASAPSCLVCFPSAEMRIAAFVWKSTLPKLRKVHKAFVLYYTQVRSSSRAPLANSELKCAVSLLSLVHNILVKAQSFCADELGRLMCENKEQLQLVCSLNSATLHAFSHALRTAVTDVAPTLMTQTAKSALERWLSHVIHVLEETSITEATLHENSV